MSATEFVDTENLGIAAAEGGSETSYYAVSSVDDQGAESAQSLGISPASIASSAGSAAGAAAGCFVDTVGQSMSKQGYLWVVLVIIGVMVTIRRKAHGARRQINEFRSQRSEDRR